MKKSTIQTILIILLALSICFVSCYPARDGYSKNHGCPVQRSGLGRSIGTF